MHGIMATAEGYNVTGAVSTSLEIAGLVIDFILTHPYLSIFAGAAIVSVGVALWHSLK